MAIEPSLSAIPFPLRWTVPPIESETDGVAALTMSAGRRTDMFIDPGGSAAVDNAPRLLGTPPGDFALVARLDVDFAADFDAGALLLYGSDAVWAKLCFEYSPQREPMVVSVVTHGTSDDANSYVVECSAHWLRVSRAGAAYAFHASADGGRWSFVRHFSLGSSTSPVGLGFVAQSPKGEGCTVRFMDIRYIDSAPLQLRDGS
jgi:regulation of enolase protein 1 (concanavalin A-like superfamily)